MSAASIPEQDLAAFRRPRANVLLISVDALRPDHMGVYGYPRKTTPNLDLWAKDAYVVERAYCQVPHTSFSIASLLTGVSLYPTGQKDGEPRSIAKLAQRYGIKTGAFFPPSIFYIDREKLAGLERSRFEFEYVKYEHMDAAGRVDQVLAFLEEYRDRQTLVWAHFFDPHEPYQAREGFRFGRNDVDRYDSEVAYTDHHLGRLLSYVRTRRPETIVALVADHGEEFGECGGYYHGNSLAEPQVRVPFILWVPGMVGRRLPGPAQASDIPATILSLLDIPAPASMQGTDLVPWLAGADVRALPSVLVELDRSKMVVHGKRKLLCYFAQDSCELFDLEREPCRALPQSSLTRRAAGRLQREMEQRLSSRGPRGRAGSKEEHCQRLIGRASRMDPTVVPEILRWCSAGRQRREATRALVALRSPRALPELLRAARDPDPEIRARATAGAALLGDRGSLERAAELIREERILPEIRRDALVALVKTGDRTAVLPLAEHLASSRDIYEQIEIIETLGQSGSPEAAPFLREKLGQLRSRLASIEALGRLRDAGSVPALVRSLREDRFVSWRRAAARALGEIGGPDAIRALLHAARKEREPDVAARALAALRRLKAMAPLRPMSLAARSWSCRSTACALGLGLRCPAIEGRELLLLSEETPRPSSRRLTVRCGGAPVASLVLGEDAAVLRLTGSLPGTLTLHSEGGAPAVLYGVIRKAPIGQIH